MKIGGFQKNSLIDFPQTIACVIFTRGCNFTCPYCHNPDLVAGPRKGPGPAFDEEKIIAFLQKRKGLLEGVVITGGEPTLQKDLVEFCRKVKSMGYRLKMDTNGTSPAALAALFKENLLDYVAMDLKTCLEDYTGVWPKNPDTEKITQSIRLIMDRAPGYEFRTTCVRPFVTREKIKRMGALINGAKQYILQNCSADVAVLDPGFLKKKTSFFSQEEIRELQETAKGYVENVTVR